MVSNPQSVAEYTRYTSPQRLLIMAGICLAMLLEVLDLTIVNVAIPSMMGNLGVTIDEINWVSTAYMLSNGIMLPMTGWLEAYFGRRRLLLAASILFTVASLGCGVSHTFGLLIVFRILQGLGGAILMSTGMSTVFDIFPPQQTGLAMAATGITLMVGPAIGPIIGGWLVDTYAWPWIFFINLVPGILAVILLYVNMKPPQAAHQTQPPLDRLGMLLLIIGLGSLQVVLEKGEREGWMDSTFIRVLVCAAVIGLTLFIIRALTIEKPLVNLRVFRHRTLTAGCILGFVVGIGTFGILFLLPVFLQNLRQYTAFQSGTIMLTWAMASAVSMVVAGVLTTRYSPRIPIGIGFVCSAIGLVMLSRVTYLTGPEHLMIPQILVGAGIGFSMVSLITASLAGLTGLELGDASGLFNMSRQLGGSIGIAILATLLNNRGTVHHAMLTESVNVYNTETMMRLTQMQQFFQSKGAAATAAMQQALASLEITIRSQAVLQAFNDVFLFVAIVFALSLPLVLLLRDTPAGTGMPMH